MPNRYDLALALIQNGYGQRPPEVTVSTSAREKTYPLESMRLAMTSTRPDAGLMEQSLQMPAAGRLVGIEFFVDTPSTGDYVAAKLRDKTLFPRLFVDLANKVSYEMKLDEETERGDLLTVGYFTVDATSKTLTWTPSFRQRILQ